MATQTSRMLVCFELDRRRFAIPAPAVREIVRSVAVSRLPRAPAIVEGMINLRGTAVPVLDIRRRFGLPAAPADPQHHFVVARAGGRTVVLRVDRAIELVEVPEAAVEPPSIPGTQYTAGIAKLADGLLMIHDLDRFLSFPESVALDEALAALRSPQPPMSPGN